MALMTCAEAHPNGYEAPLADREDGEQLATALRDLIDPFEGALFAFDAGGRLLASAIDVEWLRLLAGNEADADSRRGEAPPWQLTPGIACEKARQALSGEEFGEEGFPGVSIRAFPLRTGSRIVGVGVLLWGRPAVDEASVSALADRCGISAGELSAAIDRAAAPDERELIAVRRRLLAAARLISELARRSPAGEVESRLASDEWERRVEARAQSLRNADALLERFFSITHMLVAFMSRDFRLIRVNRAYAEFSGETPEALEGRDHFDLHPNRAVRELFKKVSETGETHYAHSMPLMTARGKDVPSYFDWNLQPLSGPDGEGGELLLFAVNVTERVRAHQTLLAREQRIRELEEELEELGRFERANRTSVSARMLGVRSLHQADPETREALVETYGRVLELSLEQRTFKVEHDVSNDLQWIAETVARRLGGPRDIVDIHIEFLRRRSAHENARKMKAYLAEGRVVLLELMGRLASNYRKYASATISAMGRADRTEPAPGRGEGDRL